MVLFWFVFAVVLFEAFVAVLSLWLTVKLVKTNMFVGEMGDRRQRTYWNGEG